jgi:hypothetical protein
MPERLNGAAGTRFSAQCVLNPGARKGKGKVKGKKMTRSFFELQVIRKAIKETSGTG